jgi:CMP-N,N'-diacetyllegionaminic acid synthase
MVRSFQLRAEEPHGSKNSRMKIQGVILARGGSKGIPNKNIINFCGKPLIAWTIEQCLSSKYIDSIWVSSDSQEILRIARKYGAKPIHRPDNISGDFSSSESAWLHAIEFIEENSSIDLVLAPQVTSPLREVKDINNAIELFQEENYDSMFSSSIVEDLFFWKKNKDNKLHSINYDYVNRQRRQDIEEKIIENGSFYLFRPKVIKKYNNRFGGKIGHSKMEFWKMFEIDNLNDVRMCKALMQEFLLK